MKRLSRAFTLLEVLVALTIFATVAAVVLVAAGRSLQNAARLEEKTLASWIADNHLAELQLRRPTPQPGRETLTLDYAGRAWELSSEIEASGDPSLYRVRVWVTSRGEHAWGIPLEERAALELTGFLGVQP